MSRMRANTSKGVSMRRIACHILGAFSVLSLLVCLAVAAASFLLHRRVGFIVWIRPHAVTWLSASRGNFQVRGEVLAPDVRIEALHIYGQRRGTGVWIVEPPTAVEPSRRSRLPFPTERFWPNLGPNRRDRWSRAGLVLSRTIEPTGAWQYTATVPVWQPLGL